MFNAYFKMRWRIMWAKWLKLNFNLNFKRFYLHLGIFLFFMVYSLSWLHLLYICLWKHGCILTSRVFSRSAVCYMNWVMGCTCGLLVWGIIHIMWLRYPWFSIRWAVFIPCHPPLSPLVLLNITARMAWKEIRWAQQLCDIIQHLSSFCHKKAYV